MNRARIFHDVFPWFGCVALVVLLSACADDESNNSSLPTTKNRIVQKKSSAKSVISSSGVASYIKVKKELRHVFVDNDFVVDSSGNKNRDPFRSWILQPVMDTKIEKTVKKDVCSAKRIRWGAPNYSIRDLELINLVRRGRSYAQFTDSSERDSWIVRKGDCLGQEKAVIDEIGVGYVRLSITPAAPPDSPAPPPQKQDISLYPEQLELSGSILASPTDK